MKNSLYAGFIWVCLICLTILSFKYPEIKELAVIVIIGAMAAAFGYMFGVQKGERNTKKN